MALFRGHVLRSIIIAGLLLLSVHQLTKRMPESMHAFTLTQSSITIVAVSTVLLLVVTHHRRQGRVLTQTQEEVLLLFGFTLISLSAFVAYRAFGQRNNVQDICTTQRVLGDHPAHASIGPFGHGYGGLEPHRLEPHRQPRPPQRVGVPSERPSNSENTGWTCPGDAVRCVVEEWYY